MSHPNPTYDPSEHGYTEEEIARAEARMEAEREREAELYDCILTLTSARDRDLAEIAKHLSQDKRESIIRVFEFAKHN